jgi:hypothetical protein
MPGLDITGVLVGHFAAAVGVGVGYLFFGRAETIERNGPSTLQLPRQDLSKLIDSFPPLLPRAALDRSCLPVSSNRSLTISSHEHVHQHASETLDTMLGVCSHCAANRFVGGRFSIISFCAKFSKFKLSLHRTDTWKHLCSTHQELNE